MKKLLIIPFIIFTFSSFSQEIDSTYELVDPVLDVACFPEEYGSLWCFIEKSIDYDKLNSNKTSGRVIVEFVVDTTGNLINIEINNKYTTVFMDSTVENEIKRVFKSMPKWHPARQLGKKVEMKITIPLQIPYSTFKCKRH